MGRRRSEFYESLFTNMHDFDWYFSRIYEIACSCFKWEGIPLSIDPTFLEAGLIKYGAMLVFRDEDLGEFLALPCSYGGKLNVYNIPYNRNAYAPNYNYRATAENSVLIFNNYQRTPMLRGIRGYAMKLYDIDRTIMVNARSQKTPFMLAADENNRLSILNAYKEVTGNAPVIYTKKGFDPESIKIFDTKADFKGLELWQLKQNIWNECMMFLGVNNSAVDKRERALVNEIEYSQAGVYASRKPRLNQRKRGVQLINEMFGVNWSVEFDEYVIGGVDGIDEMGYNRREGEEDE